MVDTGSICARHVLWSQQYQRKCNINGLDILPVLQSKLNIVKDLDIVDGISGIPDGEFIRGGYIWKK